MKKHIPNIITLLNLLSGSIAVLYAAQSDMRSAGYFILLGIFFDFFDGWSARLLSAQSNFGKELDSLADMITSGLAPGIIFYQLLTRFAPSQGIFHFLPYTGLLLSLAAAYRLARFNLDEEQKYAFTGLPTPAAALFAVALAFTTGNTDWTSLTLHRPAALLTGILLLSFLMNSKIRLFALKFTDYSWKNNKIKYLFLLISLGLFGITGFIAVPLIILLYVLMSVVFSGKK